MNFTNSAARGCNPTSQNSRLVAAPPYRGYTGRWAINKSEYHGYLASREWALLKEQVRKRSGGKCERCLVGNHDTTHHLTYERIYHENLDDLQAVCDPCHEFLSGKRGEDPAHEIAVAAVATWANFFWLYERSFTFPESLWHLPPVGIQGKPAWHLSIRLACNEQQPSVFDSL